MKSLADLQALREKLKADIKLRRNEGTVVVVGMGTCGIAAGAREVMSAILEELAVRKLVDVQVRQTGCIGMCQFEPIVEVIAPGKEKVTYGMMTPEKAVRVVTDHIVNGNPIAEFTVAKLMK